MHIANTVAATALTVNGHTEVNGIVYASDFYAGGTSITSDENLKNKTDDVELSAEQIAEAPAIKFTWKDENKDKDVHVGTIAQYWQNIIPETVSVDKYGNLALNYQGAAMAAVINLAKEVVELKAKVAELESKLTL
jgi:Flp pilus assembly CpaE family ATPase